MAKVRPEQTVYIYGLHTEIDGLVMYVGCSVNPEKRIRQHFSEARVMSAFGNLSRPLLAWIVSNAESGNQVTFTVLDTCQASDGPALEKEWIDRARAINPKLLNTMLRSPYSCHVDAVAFPPKQPGGISEGDTVIYPIKRYGGGEWRSEIRTCKVIKIGGVRTLVGGDINGVYTERWVKLDSLRPLHSQESTP